MKDITWHVTLHVVYSFNLIFPVDILHVSNYDFSNTKLPARNIMFPLSLFAFAFSHLIVLRSHTDDDKEEMKHDFLYISFIR